MSESDGPTPNGGAYSIVHFFAGGQSADKVDADAVEVVEYNADGTQLARTYGVVTKQGPDEGKSVVREKSLRRQCDSGAEVL